MKAVFSVFLFIMVFVPPTFAGVAKDTKSGVSFEKRKIQLGKKQIVVEIADTPLKRERGLMFREVLKDDEGMLFIFDREQTLSFWMKNTLIPLSIGYFGEDRLLNEVHEMQPAVIGEKMPKTYPSREPARYALEMNKEWFAKNKITPGTSFKFIGQ